MAPLLELRGVSCRADDFRLSDVGLRLDEGEYRCVMGPTGSGKTVLLETIAGIRKVTAGHIALNGTEITDLPPEERRFGFSYQDSLLFPFLSVRENILFGPGLGRRGFARKCPKEIESRLSDIAARTGISHVLDRDPRFLSGGERQRVSLARALILEPRLLLLDEPLSAVDPETAARIRELLLSVRRSGKTAVLHVTHNPAEAKELSDSVTRIVGGTARTDETGGATKESPLFGIMA